MRDETLEYLCLHADITNGEWLVPEEAIRIDIGVNGTGNVKNCEFTYFKPGSLQYCGSHEISTDGRRFQYGYTDFIVLMEKGVRVGAVYPMGNVDLHVMILKKHQNKGYMSRFMRSGIVHQLNPRLKSVTTNCWKEFEPKKYKKLEHLVSLAGLVLKPE